MGFNGLMSFWQETGLDPLLLGQPKLWITSSDPNYLVNLTGATPTNGESLNVFNRFNDSSFNPTSAFSNKAIYSILANQPHPYGYVFWNGSTTTTLGYYRVGSTTDFSFLHQSGASSTIYWVHKNSTIENTSTTKVLAATTISSGKRGALLSILNNGATLRTPSLTIYNDVPSTSSISTPISQSYDRTVDNPIVLYSFRTDLSKSVGQDASWVYINGILDNTTQLANPTSATAASNSVMNIGNRNSNGLRMNGCVGDLIIFNGIHDEATHLKVCNYLKDKWRIS